MFLRSLSARKGFIWSHLAFRNSSKLSLHVRPWSLLIYLYRLRRYFQPFLTANWLSGLFVVMRPWSWRNCIPVQPSLWLLLFLQPRPPMIPLHNKLGLGGDERSVRNSLSCVIRNQLSFSLSLFSSPGICSFPSLSFLPSSREWGKRGRNCPFFN